MTRVLSIQTVLDVVPDVDLVNDLICVLLQRCSEDHDLVVLGHGLDELDATRSHEEKAVVLVFNVVDECFIEVEHERVDWTLRRFERVKEGWVHFRQVCKVVREHHSAG